MQQALERSKHTTLRRLLFGARHPAGGRGHGRGLARHFGDLQRFLVATEDELMAVRDIGPESARAIRAWTAEPQNLRVVERLLAAGVVPAPEVVAARRRSGRQDRRAHRRARPA